MRIDAESVRRVGKNLAERRTPLETTVFLSHLIFEGTLDRFPGLKICAAHAGGYLPAYSGRLDALCGAVGATTAER
jgi:predicted TIM-barrel fold metal-dependent hydrolase